MPAAPAGFSRGFGIENGNCMQEFHLHKKYQREIKICLMVFLALFLLGAALLVIPAEKDRNPESTRLIALMCMGLFGFLAGVAANSLKKIPRADITADDDGLWHTHEGKPRGLLRWADIGRIRERAGQQCLEIFDRTGRRRIRVEYQLTGFESLRNRLYENIRLSGERARGRDFSKNPGYHLFYWACGIGFSWLGLYIGQNSSPVLGFGGMSLLVMVLVYEYLKTVFRVEIRPQGLTVFYPLRSNRIPWAAITGIDLADTFYKGARHPEVRVFTKGSKKPYNFRQFGVDENVLLAALKQAWQEGKPQHHL
jgi:hypothetical protein